MLKYLCFAINLGSRSLLRQGTSISKCSARCRFLKSMSASMEKNNMVKGSKSNSSLNNSGAGAVLLAEKHMSEQLSSLKFSRPVTHVYDPLKYAWKPHEWYVLRGEKVLFILFLNLVGSHFKSS